MDDNKYAPPKSPVADIERQARQFEGRGALIWRVTFLSLFAALSLYFGLPEKGNISYLLLGVLCALAAVLLVRKSRWSIYPLYIVTLMMGCGLIGGIYNYVQNPALMHQAFESQLLIAWLIPLVPMVLLISCCTYARRLSRRFLDGD